jgi:hypothetical protein
LANKGVNKEFGHSEMIGLDHVADTIEELDNAMNIATAGLIQEAGYDRWKGHEMQCGRRFRRADVAGWPRSCQAVRR